VRDAIVLLGTDTLKSLVLTAEAFAKLSPQLEIKGFSIDQLQRRSTLVARVAEAIMADGPEQQDALTAGLLHDIGMLVLAVDDPPGCELVIAAAGSEQLPLHVIERREHGVTHAEVGAYLLSLWGLPLAVVEAVAYHDEPSRRIPPSSLDAVAAVHIASGLVHEQLSGRADSGTAALLDESYIDQLGVRPQLVHWRELAARELSSRESTLH